MPANKTKWYVSLYHNFFVYLPPIIIFALISVVYTGYIINYIVVLLQASETQNLNDYPFSTTSSPANAYAKGMGLLIVVSFFFFWLLICLIRTIFMDPGYFDEPLQLEYKVVLSQCIQPKYNNFYKINKDKNNKHYIQISESILNVNNNSNDSVSLNPTIDIDNYNIEDRIEFLNNFNDIISSGPLNTIEFEKLKNKIHTFLAEDRELNREKKLRSLREREVTKDLDDLNSHFKNIELNKAMLCGTCLRMKVERSHHCRQCGKCILKMDHHCPWLANCIGFRNYKYFLLIDFHGIIASILVLCTYWEAVIGYNLSSTASLALCWFVTFSYMCAVGLLGFLLWLLLVNWKLALVGQTVIENADRERFPSTKSVNIYDLGFCKNFTNVFGTNPLTWFLPFNANYKGQGFAYETIYNTIG